MEFKLSVLDVSPVSSGSSGAQALQNTLDLARLADRLGYERYWLAEHHNLPSIASSSPEVMIGHVASATERIQVGAGGIMLPNHAPLKVVETFNVLQALHPGRIDLGIGRAPGTDPVTASALRRSKDTIGAAGADDFPQQFGEMLAFGGDGFPEDHPYRSLVAMPQEIGLPPIWLLGSSGYSAKAAAQMGLGYAFASHFSPSDPTPFMRSYREDFEPSESFDKPSAILAVSVICGEDEEHARMLASSMQLGWVRMRSGKPSPLPSPEEAMVHQYTPFERQLADAYLSMQIMGDTESVRGRIEEIAEHTGADEIMVTTNVYDHGERLRSYERLAEVFEAASLRS
ncbi:MAG: LLM class flavin-dependent oxidoreductase [Rubrobacter sp.]|nr:LLM class flavin-dependent oxidoreductase [Rubrobacter sp.]